MIKILQFNSANVPRNQLCFDIVKDGRILYLWNGIVHTHQISSSPDWKSHRIIGDFNA